MHDLSAGRVAPQLLTSRYGRSLRCLADTASTNDDARADALAGAPNGHTVLADMQHRGRGSNGRVWSSPAGENLYLSIVDRPPLTLMQLPPLTLAVGLGVAHAVEALLEGGSVRSRVKWPNDVLLSGKKCAGILIEASTCGDAIDAVVIGIGLNVNCLQFPAELSAIATSLRAESPGHAPLDRAHVLAELLGAVERQVDRFVELGAADVVAALKSRLALVGRRARCGEIEGIVRGVDDSGALLLETTRGMTALYAGRLVALEL